MRREGYVSQLFSTPRLVALVIGLPVLVALPLASILSFVLGIFAFLSLFQAILGRQPAPVWTKKALTVTVLALVADALGAWASLASPYPALLLPLLVVGQPFVVLAAWAVLLPLDKVLKRKILKRAEQLREAHPELTVIGIAGSVGKTTTKELIKHLLQDLHPIATPAHVNTEMGVAQWLSRTLTGDLPAKPLLIVEMGAYRAGEIALLSRIAQPTLGVLTALGSDHLALFGSEDAIRKANAELISSLPKTGRAFILATDEESLEIAKRAPCRAETAGPYGTLKAEHVRELADGLHLSIGGWPLHLPLHGAHNTLNLLLATSVARHLGVSWERIAELLPEFRGTSHTFSVREERGVTVLDDTYNISFLSFKAALEWARVRKERPRVLLTNGLLEVGDAEEEYHARLGEIANDCIEQAVFLSPAASRAFETTFRGDVRAIADAPPVPPGALLLCVGRLPLFQIQRLLPAPPRS